MTISSLVATVCLVLTVVLLFVGSPLRFAPLGPGIVLAAVTSWLAPHRREPRLALTSLLIVTAMSLAVLVWM